MKAYASLPLFTVATLALALSGRSSSPQTKARGEDSVVVGDWRGNSVCQVRESACHDEDSLYHVARLSEKPGWFSMKGDKIVDGKPVTMGTMECKYESAGHALTCEFPRGVMRFTVQGDKMEGTMNLPDGTLWRKIVLKRVVPSER